jgi:hypothetical protein
LKFRAERIEMQSVCPDCGFTTVLGYKNTEAAKRWELSLRPVGPPDGGPGYVEFREQKCYRRWKLSLTPLCEFKHGTEQISSRETSEIAINDPIEAIILKSDDPPIPLETEPAGAAFVTDTISTNDSPSSHLESQYREGVMRQVSLSIYERNPHARQRCIEHYGCLCSVCGFDFERVYGEVGSGFIHVHHLKPLSEIRKEYVIDPIADLRPVCPNCHAMIHNGSEMITIETLKALIRRNWRAGLMGPRFP